MRYSQRIALGISVLVGCTALMGVAGLVALTDLNARLAVTDERHSDLRGLYEIGHRASTARLLMIAGKQDEEATRQLLAGLQETGRLMQKPEMNAMGDRAALRDALADIRAAFESALVQREDAAARTETNRVLAGVASLAGEMGRAIVTERQKTTGQVAQAKQMLGALLAAALLAAVTLGAWQYRSVVRPLQALRRGIGELARRRNRPMAESGPREFRDVIRQFNRMADVIRAQEQALQAQVEARGRQLAHSERLAGIGRLAAGAAHEINTPLGVIGGYAETLMRRIERATEGAAGATSAPEHATLREVAEALEVISQEVVRCHQITTDVLQLGRPDDDEEMIDLGALGQRVVRMLGRLPQWRDRTLAFEDHAGGPALVRGARGPLTQVLVNLATNALDAVEAGDGRVTMTLTMEGGSAVVRVRDNGCGMSEPEMARVFEPFVSGKARRGASGVGLGLWVSRSIVQRHGGRLSAASAGRGMGSTFTVELPALLGAMV